MSRVKHRPPPRTPEPPVIKGDAYYPFYDVDEAFFVAPPTIRNAREYSRLLVRATVTSQIDKQRLCDQWGWDPKELAEETPVAFEDYQRARCRLLFGEGISQVMEKHFDDLDNDEVERAHANFTRRSTIAVRLPQPSLNELAGVLQRAVSTKT